MLRLDNEHSPKSQGFWLIFAPEESRIDID